MLVSLASPCAAAFAPAWQGAVVAAPEAFAHPLLLTSGLGRGRSTQQPAPVQRSRRLAAAHARPRTCAPRLCMEPETTPVPADRARAYGKEEDKALRLVRTGFGGYPAGPYYDLQQSEGLEAAYAMVRSDHAVLAEWSDAEIRLALKELKTTPLELLTDSPIGPFLVLSSIAIWRDGMAPWGIAPCRAYLELCAPEGPLGFMYFGQALQPPM